MKKMIIFVILISYFILFNSYVKAGALLAWEMESPNLTIGTINITSGATTVLNTISSIDGLVNSASAINNNNNRLYLQGYQSENSVLLIINSITGSSVAAAQLNVTPPRSCASNLLTIFNTTTIKDTDQEAEIFNICRCMLK